MSKFIQGAIKHPGKLTRDAAKAGVSKHEEAEKLSHSNNPHLRGEGELGLRLMGFRALSKHDKKKK